MGHIISNIIGGAARNVAGITTPNTAMTPEQQAALAQQQASLSDQRQQLLKVLGDQNLLQPALLESLGFTKDASGNYTDTLGSQFRDLQSMQMKDLAASDPETQQLQSLFRQKQIAALQGNAEADPQLEHNLAIQEQTLRNQLQAQLGSGYETSTPGIQALNDFRQRAEGLRFQSRQGIIQNYAGAGNVNANTRATEYSPLATTSNVMSNRFGNVFNAANLTLPTTAQLTANASGFGNLADQFLKQTQLGAQTQVAQEQTQGQTGAKLFGDIMGII
jgi:hypothetical protein